MEFPIVRRHFAPPKTSFWLIKSNSSNRWFWFRKKWKTMPKIMSRKTCIFLKKTWIPYKGARSQALRAITGAHAKNMIPRPNPSWNEEKHAVEKKNKKTLFSKKPMDTPHKTSWRVTRRVKNCAQNCCCFSCLAPPLHRKAYGTATFAARHNCHWSGEVDFAWL